MIQNKPKTCKGKGLAEGYEACGTETFYVDSKTGLCTKNCYPDWLFNTDAGKLVYKGTIKPKADKITKKRKKEEKDKLKVKVTDWKHELQRKVNHIARIIDKGQPCLARGFTNCQFHGGHVFARGGNQSMRYNLHNIHRQSAQSNKFQNDDGLLREGLEIEYGKDYLQFISELRRTEPLKYSNEEYHDLYRKACQIANKLLKSIDYPVPLQLRIELRNSVNKELGIYADEYCEFTYQDTK